MKNFPKYVDLEITAFCNEKCGFCFGPKYNQDMGNLPTKFWMDVLSWLKDYAVEGIVISGGEPTTRSDLLEILAKAKNQDFKVVMSTNGKLEKRILQAADYVDWIALPVDAINPKTVKRMGGHDITFDQIYSLVEKVKNYKPNVNIKLGSVATAMNISEIVELGEKVIDSGIKISSWKIYQYSPRRSSLPRSSDFLLLNQEFDFMKNEISNLMKDAPFPIIFSSNESRNRAYLFVYPCGQLVIPNVGEAMTDFIIGNLLCEGKALLDKVSGFDHNKNNNNYNSTYL